MKTHRYVAIILKSWIENWSKSFKSYNPKTNREKKQTPKQTKQNKTYKTKPKKKPTWRGQLYFFAASLWH